MRHLESKKKIEVMPTADAKEQTEQKGRLSQDETPWPCHSFFVSVSLIAIAVLGLEYPSLSVRSCTGLLIGKSTGM